MASDTRSEGSSSESWVQLELDVSIPTPSSPRDLLSLSPSQSELSSSPLETGLTYNFNAEEAIRMLEEERARRESDITSRSSSDSEPPSLPTLSPRSPLLYSPEDKIMSALVRASNSFDNVSVMSDLYIHCRHKRCSNRFALRPPKRWMFQCYSPGSVSIDDDDDAKWFSRKGVIVLVVTNLLSLLVGGLCVMCIRYQNQHAFLPVEFSNLD